MTGQESVKQVDIDPSSLDAECDFAFKVAAKSMFERASRSSDDMTAEIVRTSIKYQVLSKHTAIFGKYKNKEKSSEEMKTIDVPVHSSGNFTTGQRQRMPPQFMNQGLLLCKSAMPRSRGGANFGA